MNKKILILFVAFGLLSGGVAFGMETSKQTPKKDLRETRTECCFVCRAYFEDVETPGDAQCCKRLICPKCVCGLNDIIGKCFCRKSTKKIEVVYSKFGDLKKRFRIVPNNLKKIQDKKLLDEFYAQSWENRFFTMLYAYLNRKEIAKKYTKSYRFEAGLKNALSFEKPFTPDGVKKTKELLKKWAKVISDKKKNK